MTIKNLQTTLKFLVRHPMSKGRVMSMLARFLRWQIGSRMVPGPVAVEFVNGSMLLAKPGMSGATGNVYAGLHEFEDMGFVLHSLRPGDLFVDIGANIGSYTILAGASVGADCISFEPNPHSFDWLVKNIGLNGLAKRVKPRREALGSQMGEANFTFDLDCGNHLVLDNAQEEDDRTKTVPLTTLDDALKGLSPALIKIDVEGFESEVIKGAQATLDSPNLRCIIMELGGLGTRYGYDEQVLREQIRSKGFDEFTYLPFERKLVERTESSLSANIIFVRDRYFIEKRLTEAEPFLVLNRRI